MKENERPGSVVLVTSTSGYFGGTGVTAYVASKHGVVGLLRASQVTAQKYGIRVNAVAPFMTPTTMTAGLAQRWQDAGLETNAPDRVAEVIEQIALDTTRRGSCTLVSSLNSVECVPKNYANACRLLENISGRWNLPGRSCSRRGWARTSLALWEKQCDLSRISEAMCSPVEIRET